VPEFYYSPDEPLPGLLVSEKNWTRISLLRGWFIICEHVSLAPFFTPSVQFLSTHLVISPALNKVRDSFLSPSPAVANEANGIGLQKSSGLT